MSPRALALGAAAWLAAIGASVDASPRKDAQMTADEEVIGEATMFSDGTISLALFRPAQGFFRYPKTHPQYGYILSHVGPIKPGERRGVRPFLPSGGTGPAPDSAVAAMPSSTPASRRAR